MQEIVLLQRRLLEPKGDKHLPAQISFRLKDYLAQLNKRVHSLQIQKKHQQIAANKLRLQLQKLQQVDIDSVSRQKDILMASERERQLLANRHQSAQTFKEELRQRVTNSVNYVREDRRWRAQSTRESKALCKDLRSKVLEDNLSEARSKREEVIKMEEAIRGRRQRYEEFKRRRARQNYIGKVEKHYNDYLQKLEQLKDTKAREQAMANRYLPTPSSQEKEKGPRTRRLIIPTDEGQRGIFNATQV